SGPPARALRARRRDRRVDDRAVPRHERRQRRAHVRGAVSVWSHAREAGDDDRARQARVPCVLGTEGGVRITAAIMHVPGVGRDASCASITRALAPLRPIVVADPERRGAWPTARRAWLAGIEAGGTHHL